MDWSAIQLDFLGALDMSLSGKGGGYFVSQQAGDNTYYLVAGFSLSSYWGNSVTENYDAARKTRDELKAQEGTSKLGSTEDTAINTTTDTTDQVKGKQSGKTVKPVIKIARNCSGVLSSYISSVIINQFFTGGRREADPAAVAVLPLCLRDLSCFLHFSKIQAQ